MQQARLEVHAVNTDDDAHETPIENSFLRVGGFVLGELPDGAQHDRVPQVATVLRDDRDWWWMGSGLVVDG